MAQTKFKYNINKFIDELPRQITIGNLVKVLDEEHNINRDTFYRDRNLKVSDKFCIPSNRLDTYAALFGKTPDELKNYETKKIKPLSERKLSTVQSKVVKSAKLSK
jgi:hypothetical protein